MSAETKDKLSTVLGSAGVVGGTVVALVAGASSAPVIASVAAVTSVAIGAGALYVKLTNKEKDRE
jgi:hypothetical protein